MGARLVYSHVVGESLIHVIDPVADQTLKYIIEKLGYTKLFDDRVDVTTDHRHWKKNEMADHVGKVRLNRVRAKLNPNVDPASIKWEGSGTTIDLGNGNTLVTQNGPRTANRRPWADGMHFSKSKFEIFTDDVIDTHLMDHTVGCSQSMEVTMEFENEHLANEALSRIYQCFTNGDKIGYVDIAYDVPIPKETQSLLKYLYHLKCLDADHPNGAFGDDKKYRSGEWFDWLNKGSNKVITLLVNRNRIDNDHVELVINKNNFQALYLIECSQETPIPLDPEGASITFTVTLQYARSDRIILEYPIIANNHYVSGKFVPLERKDRAKGPESMIMWDNPSVAGMWLKTYTQYWPPKPYMFPYWDPWLMPQDCRAWMNNYRPVLIAAFTLDNLKDPEGVTKFDFDTDVAKSLGCRLDELIIECIHTQKNKVFQVDSFVNITVFADDVAVDNKFLDISDGHTLIIKNRRHVPVYRMAVSIGPKVREHVHQWNRVWIVNINAINCDRGGLIGPTHTLKKGYPTNGVWQRRIK